MMEIMKQIYENPLILEYLRYHPEWYKILYYDKGKITDFLAEAKKALKIRTYDKIENIKNQLGFLTSLIEYIGK